LDFFGFYGFYYEDNDAYFDYLEKLFSLPFENKEKNVQQAQAKEEKVKNINIEEKKEMKPESKATIFLFLI